MTLPKQSWVGGGGIVIVYQKKKKKIWMRKNETFNLTELYYTSINLNQFDYQAVRLDF